VKSGLPNIFIAKDRPHRRPVGSSGHFRMTGYLEVMDFSVEHGYGYLGILAGNEEPVCQFKLSNQGFTPLLRKQGCSLCQNCRVSFLHRFTDNVRTIEKV
jgi:hypothetical protein